MAFKPANENHFLVINSSSQGSEIVRIDNGETIITTQRLPIGQICHAITSHVKEIGTQYLYNICCSAFVPQKIELGPSLSVYAIRLYQCKAMRRRYHGGESIYLEVPNLHLQIKNVLQINNDQNITFNQYLNKNAVNGYIDCWITPIKSKNNIRGHEWVIVPAPPTILPKRIFSFTKLYEKMEGMFLEKNTNLGIVIGIGKIAVNKFLINCPTTFQLGSIRVCEYREIEIVGYKTMVLIKSKPIQLQKRFIETIVTPGGNVMIRTYVKQPFITQWNIHEPTFREIRLNHDAKTTVTPPRFNSTNHPIFGTIFFSTKMVWTAPTLRVIIGGTMLSNCYMTSNSKNVNFNIYYHILAFHDGEKYLRVPDVPAEMNDSKNFLISNNFELFGQINPSKTKQILLPPSSYVHPCCIEGRFLLTQFIKHPENMAAIKQAKEDQDEMDEKENDLYVKRAFQQNVRD